MDDRNYFVHDTAVIDPTCVIGARTQIWHFSLIMAFCVIGENCNVGQNVLISPHVVLGKNVKLHNNASICIELICDDGFYQDLWTVYTKDINSQLAFNCKNRHIKTYVGDGATIGSNATILCGNNIGKFAYVEMGAIVTQPVPDYAQVKGNPTQQTGWRSEYGQKLRFGENNIAICPESGEIYQLKDDKVTKCNPRV
jgi:UDP-2-acetamido-3-amino-2,3-dideoxy-glucuronate N-acetyltransferase